MSFLATKSEIRKALREIIIDHLDPDRFKDWAWDEDFYTDDESGSYFGNDADNQVSNDKTVSELIEAHNILMYGHVLKVRGLK